MMKWMANILPSHPGQTYCGTSTQWKNNQAFNNIQEDVLQENGSIKVYYKHMMYICVGICYHRGYNTGKEKLGPLESLRQHVMFLHCIC